MSGDFDRIYAADGRPSLDCAGALRRFPKTARHLEAEIASVLLAKSVAHPRVRRLLNKDHFTVGGKMINAFASMKSFRHDRLFDRWDFVTTLKERKITPHITVQGHQTKTGKRRKTAVDKRTTRHPGYAISQIVKKRVEEVFGLTKYASGQRQTKFCGLKRVTQHFKNTSQL